MPGALNLYRQLCYYRLHCFGPMKAAVTKTRGPRNKEERLHVAVHVVVFEYWMKMNMHAVCCTWHVFRGGKH